MPLDLPLPEDLLPLPPFVRLVAMHCPAVNKLLFQIVKEGLLDKKVLAHKAGLYLAGLCQFNDRIHNHTEGREWYERLLSKYRTRDAESHNWKFYWDKRKDAGKMVRSCTTWEMNFSLCDGCPQRNRSEFSNPKHFHYGKRVEKTKIADAGLSTPEEMQRTAMQEAFNALFRIAGLTETPIT